ncbi:hypothetical protein [Collimonas sp.]|uniref:hypothetical protein n=1 Tax=Collimonas sp. TaxID=1963772 RepID=UPI002C8F6CF3|nr:hypothetical protein [Collimonas sp.]HWW07599.1 hypothetical protein [Collimonas sp.]
MSPSSKLMLVLFGERQVQDSMQLRGPSKAVKFLCEGMDVAHLERVADADEPRPIFTQEALAKQRGWLLARNMENPQESAERQVVRSDAIATDWSRLGDNLKRFRQLSDLEAEHERTITIWLAWVASQQLPPQAFFVRWT